MVEQQKKYRRCIGYVFLCLFTTPVWAAPPFITDDADPADYRQLQLIPFATFFKGPHTQYWLLPALEADAGIYPNLEAHLIIPMARFIPDQGGRAYGLGDVELNFKYRFLTETAQRPEIAIVPTFELPAGDAERNLGNGRTWYKLPIWIEKNWQGWTSYGGGGYGFNAAPNMKNYFFGGWLIQRNFSDVFALGTEIYYQGRLSYHTTFIPFQDNGAVTLLNTGGSYALSKNTALLFSIGHSIAGTPQWVSYLGIYTQQLF